MSKQVIPKEYEWIKEGVFVIYAHNKDLAMQICSLPFKQESGEWMAHYTNAKENGRVNCEYISPYVSDSGKLQQARAVLSEHSEAVEDATLMSKSYPKKQDEEMHIYHALAAFADAIGGGE